MTKHPLTPLERALLRAVVERGEEACLPFIYEAVDKTGRHTNVGNAEIYLMRLVGEGYLKQADRPDDYGHARRYWRPAFDLTDILAAGRAGGDDDKETR